MPLDKKQTNVFGGDLIKNKNIARHQWLMPVILATWEAKIRKMAIQSQPRQIVQKTPSPK
jgi:hypothetical protein